MRGWKEGRSSPGDTKDSIVEVVVAESTSGGKDVKSVLEELELDCCLLSILPKTHINLSYHAITRE